MALERAAFDPSSCYLRHIVRATAATPGAVLTPSGAYFAPVVSAGDIYDGMNGRSGWISGTYEPKLNESGTVALNFPNSAGADGLLHRQRFGVCKKDTDYRIGEEWIEVYVGGRLKFVMTPQDAKVTMSTVSISGPDAFEVLRRSRSGEFERWNHSPRDAMEHYSGIMVPLDAAAFDEGVDPETLGYFASIEKTIGRFRWQGSQYTGSTRAPATLTVGASPSYIAFTKSAIIGTNTTWRCSARVAAVPIGTTTTSANRSAGLSVWYKSGGTWYLGVSIAPYSTGNRLYVDDNGVNFFQINADDPPDVDNPATVETHEFKFFDGWLFAYVNGRLIGCVPWRPPANTEVQVGVRLGGGSAGEVHYVYAMEAAVRRQFLGAGTYTGDQLMLPGAPVPGGLRGRYFDEQDSTPTPSLGTISYGQFFLSPLREFSASRLDPVVNFVGSSYVGVDPPTWRAGGLGEDGFGVIWTGSIYLDLTGNGRKLFLSSDDEARVWVGNLNRDAYLLLTNVNSAETGNLKTTFGAVKGWFPIKIEFRQGSSYAGVTLQDSALDGSGNPTGYAVVPASRLSPEGCYEDTVRYESFGEAFEPVAAGFGYQWMVEPRSLESGAFPGRLVPLPRIGADTVVEIGELDVASPSVDLTAQDAVDVLLADAAGIADPNASSQLTARVIDSVGFRSRAFEQADYVSLSEISEAAFLVQRARSMLALRSSLWEALSASAAPNIHAAVDKFDLTGSAGLFDWQPGMGVRLNWPSLNVSDATPRQVTGVQWSIRPGGRSRPAPTFKNRPRGLTTLLKKIQRDAVSPNRNYQGQLAVINGTMAANPTIGGIPDNVSRVSMPADVRRVVKATLVAHYRGGANTTPWTATVNGSSTNVKINDSGRYDITRWLSRDGNSAHYRSYVGVTGGSGSLEFTVELLVRV